LFSIKQKLLIKIFNKFGKRKISIYDYDYYNHAGLFIFKGFITIYILA